MGDHTDSEKQYVSLFCSLSGLEYKSERNSKSQKWKYWETCSLSKSYYSGSLLSEPELPMFHVHLKTFAL